MRFAFKALVVCVLAGLIATSGNSQQITASIRGTVVDASGAVVSSAAVTATQAETGFTRTVTSDGQGDFIVIELPVGHYRVEAAAKGFQKFVQEGVTLDVNQTATVTMRLAVGTTTEKVEVHADATLIRSRHDQPRQNSSG